MYGLKNVVMNPNVALKAQEDPVFSHSVFKKFVAFLDDDWGDVTAQEKDVNNKSLESGGFIFGLYSVRGQDSDDLIKIRITAGPEDENHKRIVVIAFASELARGFDHD